MLKDDFSDSEINVADVIKDHTQKIRPISQRFTEILRFENFEMTRSFYTLTYPNCSIFEIQGSSFGYSSLFMCSHVVQLLLYYQFQKKNWDPPPRAWPAHSTY